MYLQTVLRLNSEGSLHYDGRHGIMTHNLDYVLSSLFSGLKRCCERKLCLGDLALSPDGTGNDCVKCFTVLFFAWELTTGSHWSKSLCFSSFGSLMEIFLSDCVWKHRMIYLFFQQDVEKIFSLELFEAYYLNLSNWILQRNIMLGLDLEWYSSFFARYCTQAFRSLLAR